MPNGQLYVVATPIGNLGDITLRALEVLKSVDFVLCEDTRHTQKLLNHFEIKVPTISYHQHSDEKKVREIKELLLAGKNLALVTDAGTPGISDPGGWLVHRLTIEQFDSGSIRLGRNYGASNLTIISVPGPSAVITALSISGFPTDRFLFLGFPPHKGRAKFFQEVAEAKHTVVFYESSHRIKKCLIELAGVLDENRQVCICRELTKQFESIYRGTIEKILQMNIPEKGEFVIVATGNR